MMTKTRPVVEKLLGIKPSEWEGAMSFFLVVLAFTFGSSIARSIGMTLLVEHLGGAVLPKIFIIIDSLAFFGFLAYGHYSKKRSEISLFMGLFIVGAVFSMVAQVLFLFATQKWIYGFFFVGFFLIYVFISIHMGSVLAAYFNTVQLKRLTGVINAGLPIGGALGGITLMGLLQFLPPHWLLLMMAVAYFYAYWLLRRLNRRLSPVRSGRCTFKDVKPFAEEVRSAVSYLLNSPLLIYMALGLLVFVGANKLLEYQYQALIYPQTFPDATERATFFAAYDVFANLVWLVLQLFLTSRLIVNLGVGLSNLIHPILVGLVSVLLMFNFSFVPGFIAQFVNQEMRLAIRAPAFNLLFNAISPNLWGTTKAFINGIIFPLGTLLGSFTLLFLEGRLEREMLTTLLPVLTLILAVIGVLLAVPQWWAYNRGVFGLLNRRLFSEGNAAVGKTTQMESALKAELADPDPQNVITALGVVRVLKLKSLTHAVGKLLYNSDHPEIKQHCVNALAALPRSEAVVTYLFKTLKLERNPETLALILKNMRQAVLHAREIIPPVEKLLSHPHPEVFVQSCLYLYHQPVYAHKADLEQRLLTRLQQPQLPRFSLYLYAVGELHQARHGSQVEPFLSHPQPDIRISAFKAYIRMLEGSLNRYKQRFIQALSSPLKEIKIAALQALRECSPPRNWRPVIQLLGSQDRVLIHETLELLRLRLNSCRPALEAEIFKPDIPVEEKFEILVLVYSHLTPQQCQQLTDDGHRHLREYVKICNLCFLCAHQDIPEELRELMLKVLAEIAEFELLHTLTVLTFLAGEDREFFHRVSRGLQSPNRANQGNALEVLSNASEKSLSLKILRYFEERPDESGRFAEVYQALFDQASPIDQNNYPTHLAALEHPLLQACLLYLDYNLRDLPYPEEREIQAETLGYLKIS